MPSPQAPPPRGGAFCRATNTASLTPPSGATQAFPPHHPYRSPCPPAQATADIYRALSLFLDAYKNEDRHTLASRFAIDGDFCTEIYEMLDFVADKSRLHLAAAADIDKAAGGGREKNLDIFPMRTPGHLGIEAVLYDAGESVAIIVAEYRPIHPRLYFKYFST